MLTHLKNTLLRKKGKIKIKTISASLVQANAFTRFEYLCLNYNNISLTSKPIVRFYHILGKIATRSIVRLVFIRRFIVFCCLTFTAWFYRMLTIRALFMWKYNKHWPMPLTSWAGFLFHYYNPYLVKSLLCQKLHPQFGHTPDSGSLFCFQSLQFQHWTR